MDQARASILPTLLVSQLGLLAIGMIGGFDPLLVTSMVIALEVAAALAMVVRDAPFARFTAGAHLALAAWYVARLLLVQCAMPVWAGITLGAVLFARLLGYGMQMRGGVAVVGVLMPAVAMSSGVVGENHVWAPLAVMSACAVVAARLPARPVIVRSELPGVRVAAIALGLALALEVAMASLPFGGSYEALLVPDLLASTVVVAALAAIFAGPLPRWAIGGVLAIVAAHIPRLYFGAAVLRLTHQGEWPAHSASAMVGALPVILDAFGHVVLGAALLVHAASIPGASVRRLRLLLGTYGLVSGLFIVGSQQRFVLASSPLPTLSLEAVNFLCSATSLLATAVFFAFLLSYRRAALQRGIPTARQLT